MKILFNLIKWIVALGLLLSLLLTLLHLWPDEELDPAAAAWLEPISAAPAPGSNAYFWLLGFEVAADQDPQAAGLARSEAIAAGYRARAQSGRFELTTPKPELTLPKGLADSLCRLEEAECPARLTQTQDRIRQGMVDAQVLVGRYLALYDRPFYHDPNPVGIDTPLPNFAAVTAVQRLILANAWLDAREGRIGDAVATLERDLLAARALLARAESLLPKMVAVGLVRQDLHLLAHLLDLGADPATAGLIDRLAPLTPAEYDLSPALRLEFAVAADITRALPRLTRLAGEGVFPPGAAWLPFKPNATLNRTFSLYHPLAQVSTLDHRAFALQAPTLRPSPPDWRDYAFNPVGTILMEVALPALAPYAARTRDLEGLIRLVRLKRMILTQGIAAGAVEGFLAAQPEALRDPFTGAPLGWTPTTATLSFPSPLDEHLPGVRSVPIPALAPAAAPSSPPSGA